MSKKPQRDRALEYVNSLPRHRKYKPVRDPSASFVMVVVATLCLGIMLWAVGTVFAHLMGWLS